MPFNLAMAFFDLFKTALPWFAFSLLRKYQTTAIPRDSMSMFELAIRFSCPDGALAEN
jgi:hypothetical protein